MHVMSSKLVLTGQYNGLIGIRPPQRRAYPNAGLTPTQGQADANPHTDVHEQPAVKAVIT